MMIPVWKGTAREINLREPGWHVIKGEWILVCDNGDAYRWQHDPRLTLKVAADMPVHDGRFDCRAYEIDGTWTEKRLNFEEARTWVGGCLTYVKAGENVLLCDEDGIQKGLPTNMRWRALLGRVIRAPRGILG